MKKIILKTATEAVLDIITRAKDLGVSGNSLCKKAELDRSTLRRWVSGECEPSLTNFMKLEFAFTELTKKSRALK